MASPTAAKPGLDAAEVTATVARVMASLLKKDHVGDHDNFFDIGGHSLLAMRLLGRLRREGLDEVTIQDIVETGSPAALAARLTGGGSGQILPLGPGTLAPVFAVHPGGGFALPFRGLADRLTDHDVPVTGLQLP
ncbi:phosphopantetheine-binding protein, partial [Corynebacterium variabile]|uniref:phosphopantetheine-binding protein n=1 Tax=Corynebacterium variabile TaxID=1727 RepID=UPI002FE03FFF